MNKIAKWTSNPFEGIGLTACKNHSVEDDNILSLRNALTERKDYFNFCLIKIKCYRC